MFIKNNSSCESTLYAVRVIRPPKPYVHLMFAAAMYPQVQSVLVGFFAEAALERFLPGMGS